MPCALCLEDKELQRSHIIPEFMYGSMYDEKHRYNVLSVRPGDRERTEQKGARERLLCFSCEQHVSKFEHYASLVIKGGAPKVQGSRDGNIVSVTGIDYATFKLFLLSLVWRAGIAKHAFFEQVQLGPHQERIRAMIRAGDPGPFDLYPCILWGLNMEPREVPGLMIQPSKDRVWGHTTYHFVLPGLKLVFFVSSQPLGRSQSQFVLQPNGSLVFQVRSPLELPSLHNFMRKFEGQG